MSAWKVAGEDKTLVYESYDWEEPGVLPYDSVHTNPPPDAGTATTGGYTALLELAPGDRLDFECEIVNDESFALRWANEAETAEMCILRGNYAPSLGRAWSSYTP